MKGYLTEPGDWEKQQKAINDTILKAAKTSKSEILKTTAKEIKAENDPEIRNRCRIVRMLIDEMLSEYEEGEVTFKEAIDDLYKALKEI